MNPFQLNRRNFLYGLGSSLGSVAFSKLLADQADTDSRPGGRQKKDAAKAKACIMLFMEGGPSHIDTFDPKPKLDQLHLNKFTIEGPRFSGMSGATGFT